MQMAMFAAATERAHSQVFRTRDTLFARDAHERRQSEARAYQASPPRFKLPPEAIILSGKLRVQLFEPCEMMLAATRTRTTTLEGRRQRDGGVLVKVSIDEGRMIGLYSRLLLI
jgi:hypothetical protein